MRSIFTGLVLITFNFTFFTTFDWLPDFVGYYFIYRGLSELATQNSWFRRLRPWSVGMLIALMVVFFLDFIPSLPAGISPLFTIVLLLVLGTGMSVALLYLLYGIVRGVRDMETAQGRYLRGDKLYRMWKIRTVFNVLSVVFTLLTLFWPLAGILALGGGIASICFLYSFYQTRKLYIQDDTSQSPA